MEAQNTKEKQTSTTEHSQQLPVPKEINSGLIKRLKKANEERKETKSTPENSKIDVDLNQVNPCDAAKTLQENLDNINQQSTVVEYLKKTSFEDINFEDINIAQEDISTKRQILDNIIYLLEKNQSLNIDSEFIQKLYKLKETHELVNDSVKTQKLTKEIENLEKETWDFILTYSQAVEKYVKNLISAPKKTNEQEEQTKQIQDLTITLTNTKTERDEFEQESNKNKEKLTQLLQNLLKILSPYQENSDAEEDENSEEIKLDEQITTALQNVINDNNGLKEQNNKLLEEISNQTTNPEELKKLQEDITNLQSKHYQELENKEKTIDKLQQELQTKTKLCEGLSQELDDLREEQEKAPMLQPGPEPTREAIKPREQEEPKKKSKGLKILGIILLFFILIIGGGLTYGYLSQDKPKIPVQKPNYQPLKPKAKPIPKPTVKSKTQEKPVKQVSVTPEPIKQDPTPQTTQEATPVPEPTITEEPKPEPFDFERVMTTSELRAQDFKIKNSSTIVYHERTFKAREVLNGFTFIKATSEGQILFVSPKSKSVWVGR